MRSLILPLLLGLTLCGTGTGCFIFDELDKGAAIMDQHSRKGSKKKSSADAEKGKEGLTGLAAWKARGKATVDKLNETVEEATKKELDPDNVIIRCKVEGRVQYTRSFDCQALGGQIVMR